MPDKKGPRGRKRRRRRPGGPPHVPRKRSKSRIFRGGGPTWSQKYATDAHKRIKSAKDWPIQRNLISAFRPHADILLRTQLMAMKILGLSAVTAVFFGAYRLLRRRLRDSIDEIALFYMLQARKELKPGGYKRGPRGGRVADPPAQHPFIYSRTGRLSSSLSASSEIRGDTLSLTVTNTAPYAGALEFGTKFIKPREWMVGTFNRNKRIMRTMAGLKAKRPIPEVELRRRLG